MSMLDELWRGRLAPGNHMVQDGSEYQQLQRECHEDEEKFRSGLSQEMQEAYEKLSSKQDMLSNLAERDSFIRGFRLAGLLALEVVSGDTSMFIQK